MEEVVIPHFFVCPISLEIMRDPVTVSTGITYDRESIERWIFTSKNKTCPITRQPLPDTDITPNHTLRRLIQAWCIANAANGVDRIPTPRPPVDKAQITKLLEGARNPQSQMGSLHRLKAIAAESDRNKRCIEAAGAVSILASLLKCNSTANPEEIALDDGVEQTRASDEALNILYNLQISEEALRDLASKKEEFISSLMQIMQRGNDESRAYATFLLNSLFKVVDPISFFGLRSEVFKQIVNVLRDQISNQATKAALEILIDAAPWGRNRVKAAEAGAVHVLIELLLDTQEKRACEMMLVVLDQICKSAQGRANFLSHSAGLAVVSKKIIRVSPVASERAIRILHSIATFSANSSVVHEMLQVGVVSKLCLVLQVDCGMKTKQKAKEILIRHSKSWRNSPCVPTHLLSSIPAQH
ncbi:hypothetical protein MRB53_018281 [Persea americana]|uniref:Uncharacterized protein n=1 Tax=Persea americana TaxID=3435 RepID=A0ACC2M7F5_PERAE|nr:hypothetical protein MRB53_018281 [Persea americana]